MSSSVSPSDNTRTVTPSDTELTDALRNLRTEHPALGVTKLHARLLETHGAWLVSEKRTKKLAQAAGLTNSATPTAAQNGTGGASKNGRVYPESKETKGLDVEKWTKKVRVHNFGRKKGKGLVAVEHIEDGEAVWKEDPWVVAPEWEIYDLIQQSRACAHCTTPFTPSSTLTVPCATCDVRFCNRLCASRAQAQHHPLLCPGRNPPGARLVKFARTREWMAVHALAMSAARLVLARQAGLDEFEKEWAVFEGLAVLGMEERAKDDWYGGAEPDRDAWKRAHELFSQALSDPPNEGEKKKLAKITKQSLPDYAAKALFSYEGFLRALGRMSLNLEAHGGLYTLHSHLNHSCTPNISVRHIDQRSNLARITLFSKIAILPGEELVITYVDPTLGVRARRRKLAEWGFGECDCGRCVAEENALREKGEWERPEKEESLEEELKRGFGVV